MNSRISVAGRESRLPVGSSAKMICGRVARARATATRCCWPPDSSAGRCVQPVAQAHGLDDRVDPLRVGLAAGQVHRQRDVLGCRQGRQQVERLEDEADPVAAQQRELSVVQVRQVRATDEDLAGGQAVEPREQCSSVDLPEPDGPMMAVNRARANSTETPSSALTSVSAVP